MPNGHRDDDPHHIPEDPPKRVMPIGAGISSVGKQPSYLTIRIELPQPLSYVSELMLKVAEFWPTAKTVPNDVDGWTIEVEAVE